MGTYLGKTSANSDPVTGEWHGGRARLEKVGIPYIVVERMEDRHRKKPNTVAPPVKIHRNVVEGHLGGQVFSRKMLRFLDGRDEEAEETMPNNISAERNWWAGEDAEREMRAYFPSDAVDAVLAKFRDGASWDVALQCTSRGIAEVKVIMRAMRRHCKTVIRQQLAAA